MYNKQTLYIKLKDTLPNSTVLIDEPMANHTTFEIGGPADIMVLPSSLEDIQTALTLAKEDNAPFHLMGLGSNILCADEGLRGVVIKLAENYSAITRSGTTLVCQSGASNEAIANVALEAGLGGYEFASGIPGSIGGAAYMNAGAYDGEFKDVATSVKVLTPAGEMHTLSKEEACWSYRHSLMMDKDFIVVEATLELSEKDAAEIKAKMDELRQKREDKQPLEMPSAGSTFKRPEGYFVGKLLQDAGLRGFSVGGAQVSEKHCGFVVNFNHATASDVRNLISAVQEKIYEKDGVKLEPEVRMWGFTE
ncbi:MAG: UDP-N-acetylmuramate dehydrogenase [Anaerotardibacter sp.]